jgi:DNA-binding PadR family transcriptional regulator
MIKSNSLHSFSPILAKKLSVEHAVIYQNLEFWCKQNEIDNRNFHDGRYWTYNSATTFAKKFDYFSSSKIARLLRDLEESGYIVSARLSEDKRDQTKWYSVVYETIEYIHKIPNKEQQCNVHEETMDSSNLNNATPESEQCYIGTDSKQSYSKQQIDSKNDLDRFKTQFEQFRKSYSGTKRGLDTEFQNFKKHKDWKEVLQTLNQSYTNQQAARARKKVAGEFVPLMPNLQTYINQRRWEEEIAVEQPLGAVKNENALETFRIKTQPV